MQPEELPLCRLITLFSQFYFQRIHCFTLSFKKINYRVFKVINKVLAIITGMVDLELTLEGAEPEPVEVLVLPCQPLVMLQAFVVQAGILEENE